MSDISELLVAAFQYQIHEVYTALPCVVVSVDQIKDQRVDVQPLINRIAPDGTDSLHPVILAVPLIFPATSTSSLTFEVSKGDTVLCVFSQRCSDMFKAGNGKAARPTDLRIFDKRDAMAIVGLFPFGKAINNPSRRSWVHSTSDTVLSHNLGKGNEVEIRLKKDGGIVLNTHLNVEVNCTQATINGDAVVNGSTTMNGDLQVNGTVTASTDVIANGVSLKNHKHSGGTLAGGLTGVPT